MDYASNFVHGPTIGAEANQAEARRHLNNYAALLKAAGLLALAAALLIAASPTTNIELVTQPPVTGR